MTLDLPAAYATKYVAACSQQATSPSWLLTKEHLQLALDCSQKNMLFLVFA